MFKIQPSRLGLICLASLLVTGLLLNFTLLFFRPHAAIDLVRGQTSQTDGSQRIDFATRIPPLIWQIFLSSPGNSEKKGRTPENVYSSDWISMAPPGFTYTLISSAEADRFVNSSFSTRPELIKTYHSITSPVVKADLLRYLLLLSRGGIYSDVDTKPIVRLDEWIPRARQDQIRAIIAVEYDESQDPHPEDFQYPVQFCQWTMAAAPNHPLLIHMADRALAGIQHVSGLEPSELSDFDVLNATGPVAWTEVVVETLRTMHPTEVASFADLAGIREPKYIGDIVILPLESFRAEWMDDWGMRWQKRRRALVRHFWSGRWKTSSLE